jgi:hypothetical protein
MHVPVEVSHVSPAAQSVLLAHPPVAASSAAPSAAVSPDWPSLPPSVVVVGPPLDELLQAARKTEAITVNRMLPSISSLPKKAGDT